MVQDWKKTLATVKKKEFRKKEPKKVDLKELTRGFLKIHPMDMLLKLNPHFTKISYRSSGKFPVEGDPEITPEFLVDNVGDLIKVVLVRGDDVFIRTNRGYFRFFN